MWLDLYAVKAGQGVTTTAAIMALALSRRQPTLLVGDEDTPVILGQGGFGDVPGRRLSTSFTAPPTTEGFEHVVVDWGVCQPPEEAEVHEGHRSLLGHRSWMVTRCCFLALRRAVEQIGGHPPDGLVVMEEHGRAIGSKQIGETLGAPVVIDMPYEPAIARAADAGLTSCRLVRYENMIRQALERQDTGCGTGS